MPGKTFQGLKPEKQQEILDACIEEFALHDYQTASVSRIVKKLGIAKGSIYQYFKSKKELYFYLIEYSSQKRFEQIDDLFEQETDFFELLVKNFTMKVKFDLENPVLSGFQYNLLKERNTEELGNIQKIFKMKILGLIKEMMLRNEHVYQLRKDIDTDYLAFMVMQMQIGVFDFLEIHKNVNFRENILQKRPIFSIGENEIEAIIKNFAAILKSGMAMSN